MLLLLLSVRVDAAGAATPFFGTFNGCPKRVLPLPYPAATYAASARAVTLRFVRTQLPTLARKHGWRYKIAGARVIKVLLIRRWLPSGWIKTECGLRVWQRSLAVVVSFPAMQVAHCNNCGITTFLLARTRERWIVWGAL